jgi:hypothetical protein
VRINGLGVRRWRLSLGLYNGWEEAIAWLVGWLKGGCRLACWRLSTARRQAPVDGFLLEAVDGSEEAVDGLVEAVAWLVRFVGGYRGCASTGGSWKRRERLSGFRCAVCVPSFELSVLLPSCLRLSAPRTFELNESSLSMETRTEIGYLTKFKATHTI